ncbi:hypothetical protein DUPY_42680 [Duganella phyllosphaerae]|uniref:Lipoprotein n=3 Tax=Duganella TaxID=75654 RepID=A0A1E7WCT5_9BURK|nr:hypothetical protein DUPY_42680 [Duganella phyllosphaerae]
MRSVLLLVLFMFCGDACAKAETFSNIFLDRKSNAHVSLAQGGERRLTTNGRAMNVALSGDRRTAAWLVRETWELDGQRHVTADTLMAYRGGRYRRIKCSPFIRSYWFWNGGKQLAIDCGGLHFAGTLSLYDFATGKLIDSFSQPDIPEGERPAWSKPTEEY